MEFIIKCPRCGRDMIYKSKSGYKKALEENKVCRFCRDLIRGENGEYVRNCPECGKQIYYKRQSDFIKGIKQNTSCTKCRAKHSETTFKKGNKQCINNTSAIPKYSLDNLLNDSLEAYYWLGFILTDGSFYKNRFEFALKADDLKQVQNLASFLDIDCSIIKYRKSSNSYRLSFNNEESVSNIMKTYGIHYGKTYEPCEFSTFSNMSKDKLTALFIGIIDGDGSINTTGHYITITAHNS